MLFLPTTPFPKRMTVMANHLVQSTPVYICMPPQPFIDIVGHERFMVEKVLQYTVSSKKDLVNKIASRYGAPGLL